MAKNRHSELGCPSICAFDREVKKRYFPESSIPAITNLRGVFLDSEDAKSIFEDFMTSEVADLIKSLSEEERQTLREVYGSDIVFSNIVENINEKLSKRVPLSSFEESFMRAYANAIDSFLNNAIGEDIVHEEMRKAGVQTNATATMHNILESKIPSAYRYEVEEQLCSLVIRLLDKAENRPEYEHLSRREIIENFNIPGSYLRGFNALMYQTRRALQHSYDKLQKESKTNEEKETKNPEDYIMSEEEKQIFDILLHDDDAWAACVYATKNMFLEAEKIKIGNRVEYAEDFDSDEMSATDSEKEIESAEEQNPDTEHWMVKANTVSGFSSLTKEVRSLFYKLTTGERGILGFPRIADAIKVYEKLTALRYNKFIQDSDTFMAALTDIQEPWALQLQNIMAADPWKKTAVFNAVRKSNLEYVYHRKETIFSPLKEKVSIFHRNKSGRNGRVMLSVYRAGITHIDSNNTRCIFNADKNITINVQNRDALLNLLNYAAEGVQFWNAIQGIYDVSMFGMEGSLEERKRDFIWTINDYLNLHLLSADVDILMNSAKEFKKFCTSLHNIALDLYTARNKKNINQLMEKSAIRRHFQNLTAATKHFITERDEESPVEGGFRYKNSTYMTSTISYHLADVLEQIGKAASEGVSSLRSYLENTYLNCPTFATKTDDGYVIHNYILREIYNSTQKDIDNPMSVLNRLIGEITRGLGTDEAEFESFTEKDNYIFNLNEYLQNSVDSEGKFGATPLFVTGDSNSTRFFTTPILGVEEIFANMTDAVFGELDRMETFRALVDFFNNPDKVNVNSPEYKDRRKLKISDGHKGRTVAEWMEVPEEFRPPILKNKDKFTLFPFLNAYRDELVAAYDKINNAETAEEKLTAKSDFEDRVQQILRKHIHDMYHEFMQELVDRNVVIEYGKSSSGPLYTLNSKTLAIKKPDGEFLSTVNTDILYKFYLNTKFNLMQQLQFLTIDPGFYKNTEDLQKRFKETIASGGLLDLTALDVSDSSKKVDDGNGKQKVRYIDEMLTNLDASDEEGSSEEDRAVMQALRESGFYSEKDLNKYKKNTLTDGQGYRSLSSYRKMMIMRGEPCWTKAHEEAYQLIMDNRAEGRTRLTDSRYERILELGVVFQPLKPFYFGFEEVQAMDGSVILVPVQHKYSEFPIIPELLPAGCRLGELGRAMEEDHTDLVCCTTCVKVGGFGSTDIQHCKTSADFAAAFSKGYAHQLPLKGWRQQSNVPEHVDNSRAKGTQMAKTGYGCITDASGNKHYKLIDRVFTDGVIKLTKNKTINIEQGLNELNLIQLFGALSSAPFMHSSVHLNEQVGNPRKASEILSELRANDTRGAKDNIAAYTIDEDGEFFMSPAEGIMSVDNAASLFSKLRKEVIKRPMKGGSAVQVSAFGFEDVLKVHTSKTPDGKTNITYADCAAPFALSYTYEDGTVVDLSPRYREFVDPDTGMPLDENGKGVEPAEPTGNPGEEYYGWNTKLGKQFPGIYDLIAYRIPTEKYYSILNLRIKRFFPKTLGGIIMVPSQYTTIAGFDFDIDKLYFIRREYRFNKNPNIGNYDVWTDYYNIDPQGKVISKYLKQELKEATEAVKGEDRTQWSKYLGNRDFDYWKPALQAMEKDDIDISKFPKTAEEAFIKWVSMHVHKYSKLTSVYDKDKTVLENEDIAINNLFFDYMQERLEDYDTFEERLTPGGFQKLEDEMPVMLAIRYASSAELAALATAEDPEKALLELAKSKNFYPNYDPTELSTVAHYQTYNAIYDKCISIAAVQNINQRLTALLNKLKIRKPVLFGSLVKAYFNPNLSVEEREKLGCDIKARLINKEDTELLTTNFLAAAVDGVKKASLEFFGINDKNLNVGCLLSRIGYTARDIGLLLNQPVCIKAMQIVQEGKGFKSMSNALEEAMQEFIKNDYYKYKEEYYYSLSGDETNRGARDELTTTPSLIRYIGMNATPDYAGQYLNFIKGQFAVAHLMNELLVDAQELAEQVAISQSTSVKSVKSKFGAIQSILQKVMTFASRFGGDTSVFDVELPFGLQTIIDPLLRFDASNMEEQLEKCLDSPYCVEQIAFSAIMGFVDAIGDYFPYNSEGFLTAASGLANLTKRKYMSAEMFDIHNKAAMLYFAEKMTDIFNDPSVKLTLSDGTTTETGIPSRIFYTVKFAEVYDKIMKINEAAAEKDSTALRYKSIPILGSIAVMKEKISTGENVTMLKMEDIGRLQSKQKDILIDSWKTMFFSEDPVLRDLAVHLFMYSYFNKGFDFGPTTFMSLVPLVVKTLLNDGEYRKFYNRVFNLTAGLKGSLVERGGISSDPIFLKDYYKSFILNTKDLFYHFTKKLYPSDRSDTSPYKVAKNNMTTIKQDILTGAILSEEDIEKLRKKLNKEGQDADQYINNYVLEISCFTVSTTRQEDAPLLEQISSPVDTKRSKLEFTPCIEIDGAVYICDNNIKLPSNSRFNVVASGESIVYYRMDLPKGNDYSGASLYGTSRKNLVNIGDGELIPALTAFEKAYAATATVAESTSEKEDIADMGNTYGDSAERIYSADAPLLPLIDFLTDIKDILFGATIFDPEEYREMQAARVFLTTVIANIANLEGGNNLAARAEAKLEGIKDTSFLNTCSKYLDKSVEEISEELSEALEHTQNLIAMTLNESLSQMADKAENSENAKEQNICENEA